MLKNFKPITQRQFPQTKNIKFITELEKQAKSAFKIVAKSVVKEIAQHFRHERLAKSGVLSKADKLPRGWTGEVNKINIDLEKIVSPVMKKHINALRWLLYGDMAGKEAKQAAKDVGIKAKAIPGLLPSAYLQSIDAQRDYFEMVTGDEAPEIQKDLILESMKELMKRTQKFLDEFSLKFGNGITEVIQKEIDEQNYTNISQTLLTAHDKMDEGLTGTEALAETDEFSGLELPKIEIGLKGILESVGVNWDRFANANIGNAAGVGTHQAMNEIYGQEDGDIRCVLLIHEDERLCDWCNKHSKKPDGSWIYYKLSDFKPAGYNYGRKKADWQLCIPAIHPRCRCTIGYAPVGFEFKPDGTLVKI